MALDNKLLLIIIDGVPWRNFRRLFGNLEGWVANAADGSVDVVAEGPEPALGELVLMLWAGPPGASVGGVDVRHEPARGNVAGFTIRSGAHRGD